MLHTLSAAKLSATVTVVLCAEEHKNANTLQEMRSSGIRSAWHHDEPLQAICWLGTISWENFVFTEIGEIFSRRLLAGAGAHAWGPAGLPPLGQPGERGGRPYALALLWALLEGGLGGRMVRPR